MKESKSVQHRGELGRSTRVTNTARLHQGSSPSLSRSECKTHLGHAAGYVLRKGHAFWELTFAGQSAVFKHEQGAFYAAYLLLHPGAEPIHALALALEVKAFYRQAGSPLEIADPLNGRHVLIANNATLQQRSLWLDDAEAARKLHHQQRELEALLEDEDQIEPVKAEAQRDLEVIYQFQKQNAQRIRTSAEKAADAVGKAIKRLCRHLANSADAQGKPHAVLRSFGEHLKQYLLLPSGRAGTAGGLRTNENLAGCFVYRPPEGVVWRGETLERNLER